MTTGSSSAARRGIRAALLATSVGNGVGGFGFATLRLPRPRRPSPAPPAATVDAAKLLNKSVVGRVEDEVGATAHAAGAVQPASPSVARDAETTSSSHVVWVIVGALLSVSAAVGTRVWTLRTLSAASSWYLTRLEVAPLVTKCITGGIVALLGDYGAQRYERSLPSPRRTGAASSDPAVSLRAGDASTAAEHGRFSMRIAYDRRRGLARFLECLLISSPLMHFGYDLFESVAPTGGVGTYKSLAALSHVAADCLLLDGIFVLTGILATGVFEGHAFRKHVLPHARKVYLPTLKASVTTSGLLMPVQFLSFRFLPVQLRVLSVNAVDLIWTAVVSFVSHGGDVEGARA